MLNISANIFTGSAFLGSILTGGRADVPGKSYGAAPGRPAARSHEWNAGATRRKQRGTMLVL